MTRQQQKHMQMHSKLEEGLSILSRASDEDSYQLGMALLKLHAALEDYFRIEIARRAPSLRMEVEDARKTSWNELIRYGKQYLRLSEGDARVIVEANRQRQSVAHGGNYEKSRRELVRYADFVERWCSAGAASPSTFPEWAGTMPAQPYQMAASTALVPPRSSGASWYRSRTFFFLTFFLLPPLWAFLILTDRHQACLLKLLAGSLFVLELVGTMLLVHPSLDFLPASLQLFGQQLDAPLPLMGDAPVSEATPSPGALSITNTPGPAASPGAVCSVVWRQYPSEPLAGKNRAMVWEEIVMAQVDGSGLTARQFYDQVLEHNPELARDGYEFKQGKHYLLPVCE